MRAEDTERSLHKLAELRGIELSYVGHDGRTVKASTDTLTGVLGALGYPVPNAGAIREQLRLAREERRVPSPEPFAASEAPQARRPAERGVAVTTPLYAVRGRDDWGIGSFRDLRELADLAATWRANLIGTLPIFAISTDRPIDPSPYLPISRLFWNELHVDVAGAAALAGCDTPEAMRPDPLVRAGAAVDYDTVAHAKREALEACATAMHEADGRRRNAFERFVTEHEELASYAAFRANGDERAAQYHRFVQFAADRQLADAKDHGDALGIGLYLDLPVGVHPNGYDTWANPDLFADAQVGAPPDALAASGQAWGFPPLHPQRLRDSGYRYFIESLRVALRYARCIRIDHILGLQRLYWIPAGMDATSGAYVKYRHDELLAIVAFEAKRAGATVIGEDLGTVSPEIRQAMDDYGILHSFVSRFEASPDNPLPQPSQPAAASLGTHDLPRFATFWNDPASRELVAVGVPEPDRALRLCLEALAAGPAAYVIADLADLVGETVPDNRPGTGPEAGNWRRRLPLSLAELANDEATRQLMCRLADLRSNAPKEAITR
ncbi:MAG TPA: 4-alpha-glucanotransferase [Mycobacteriales bacterium]|nr:4-alpha-glucanotransferase [Mycobacteriales bacterium]